MRRRMSIVILTGALLAAVLLLPGPATAAPRAQPSSIAPGSVFDGFDAIDRRLNALIHVLRTGKVDAAATRDDARKIERMKRLLINQFGYVFDDHHSVANFYSRFENIDRRFLAALDALKDDDHRKAHKDLDDALAILNFLQQQVAQLGSSAPPGLRNGLDELEAALNAALA